MSRTSLAALRGYAVIAGILMVTPLVAVIVASLTADEVVRIPPDNWGFRWYWEAFGDSDFVGAFFFSLETAAAVALIAGVLGVGCAIAIHLYRFPGRGAVQSLVMAPLMLPRVVIAILLLLLFSKIAVTTSPYGLVAGHVLITMPFVVRLTLAGLAGIDPSLERVGRSLGASQAYVLRRIVVPLIAPSVMCGVLFAFLLSFDETVIAIFTSVPGRTTLPVLIFNYAQNRTDPFVPAVSSIVVLVGVVVILVVDRFFGLLRLLSGGELRADR